MVEGGEEEAAEGNGQANGTKDLLVRDDTNASELESQTALSLVIRLPDAPFQLNILISVADTFADIKSSLIDLPQTCCYTCFHLSFHGHDLADHEEVREVPEISANAELVLVEDSYNERDARYQLLRTREMIGFRKDRFRDQAGIDAGLYIFDQIKPNENIFSNYSVDNVEALDAVWGDSKIDLPPVCLKNLGLSQYHPPPRQLRLQGHLLYLTLTTLEDEHYHITSDVSGFYLNNSSSSEFDPSRRPRGKDHFSHSLISLLMTVSHLFVKGLQTLRSSSRDPLQSDMISNVIPASPWVVRPERTQPDLSSTQDVVLSLGTDLVYGLRDWNEEIQSTRSLPNETIQDRILRERLLAKIFAEFTSACVAGATFIARGEVMPMNPEEPSALHLFSYNNIFFSRGLDGSELFKDQGGDEAARVAVIKDVMGLRLVNKLDVDGLATIGTVVVDYMGQRIVGQSIVPGIFRQQDEGGSQIVYGGREGTYSTVDEQFPKLLGKVASALHIKEHIVHNDDGSERKLFTGVDVKGVNGADGRKYLLDLFRMTPVDVEFAKEVEDLEYPHKMTLLRPELVEEFHRVRINAWFQDRRDEVRGTGEAPEDLEIDTSDFELSMNPDAYVLPDVEDDDVIAASQFLRDKVIPDLIADFETQRTGMPIDGSALTSILHGRGINVRYLGRIATSLTDPKLKCIKQVATREMTSRAVKHIVNKELAKVDFIHAQAVVSHALNCLFDCHSEDVDPEHRLRFSGLTSQDFRAAVSKEAKIRFGYDINAFDHCTALLREVCMKLGVQLRMRDYVLDHFDADDIMNFVPLFKDTPWESALVERAFEAGRISLAQNQQGLGVELLVESLHLHEQVYGILHPNIARMYSQIGQIYFNMGEKETACELLRKAVVISERTQGLDHSETLLCYLSLSLYEHALGHTALALAYVWHALRFWRISFGNDHPDMITTLNNVAVMLQSLKQYVDSRRWYEVSLALCESVYGKTSISTATIKYQLAQAMVLTQDVRASVRAMRDAYTIFLAELGPEDKNTKETEHWLEMLTQRAVTVAKHAKMGVSPKPKHVVAANAAPVVRDHATSAMGSRSIEELVKYIGGNDSIPAKKKDLEKRRLKRRH